MDIVINHYAVYAHGNWFICSEQYSYRTTSNKYAYIYVYDANYPEDLAVILQCQPPAGRVPFEIDKKVDDSLLSSIQDFYSNVHLVSLHRSNDLRGKEFVLALMCTFNTTTTGYSLLNRNNSF
jgi:hypothetical protein